MYRVKENVGVVDPVRRKVENAKKRTVDKMFHF
jgi:hypothetical protein